MKIERYDKQTNRINFVNLKDCLAHTEGCGYSEKETVERMLEAGHDIFAPFVIYSKSKIQTCECKIPLVYSALATECSRCGGTI